MSENKGIYTTKDGSKASVFFVRLTLCVGGGGTLVGIIIKLYKYL